MTILIVTHNMQQAARVSDYTAYMYLGELIEYGVTDDDLHQAEEASRPRTTSPAASADRAGDVAPAFAQRVPAGAFFCLSMRSARPAPSFALRTMPVKFSGLADPWMMRTRLVAGNWKMHGSRASNQALLDAVLPGMRGPAGARNARSACRFPIWRRRGAAARARAIAWGAQNVSEHAQGAYTGEVSAAMLAEFGCRYVIVGHSERRAAVRRDATRRWRRSSPRRRRRA